MKNIIRSNTEKPQNKRNELLTKQNLQDQQDKSLEKLLLFQGINYFQQAQDTEDLEKEQQLQNAAQSIYILLKKIDKSHQVKNEDEDMTSHTVSTRNSQKFNIDEFRKEILNLDSDLVKIHTLIQNELSFFQQKLSFHKKHGIQYFVLQQSIHSLEMYIKLLQKKTFIRCQEDFDVQKAFQENFAILTQLAQINCNNIILNSEQFPEVVKSNPQCLQNVMFLMGYIAFEGQQFETIQMSIKFKNDSKINIEAIFPSKVFNKNQLKQIMRASDYIENYEKMKQMLLNFHACVLGLSAEIVATSSKVGKYD